MTPTSKEDNIGRDSSVLGVVAVVWMRLLIEDK
jgi:hypothetical protein